MNKPKYAVGMLLVAAVACGSKQDASSADSAAASAGAAPTVPADTRAAIVILGTSLTAGYGLRDPSRAYPAVLQAKLDSAGRAYRVVNAGVSGESSAGALARVDWLLSKEPIAILIVETGANDGLRGQDPDSVRARIQAILDRARALSPPPKLVIAGMEAMPNLGSDYVTRFRAIFPALAKANGAALIPFLLEGVAGVDSLNQDDGIHPTEAGARRVAENVWRVLEPLTRNP